MDIGSISTTISLVKDVANQVTMLKNLTSDIETATEIQEAKQKAIDLTNTIIALQTAIMTMQADYMALAEENDNLKKISDELKDYQLVQYPTKNVLTKSIWVYEYIGDKKPKHYCCPTCFEKGKRSTLQETNMPIDKNIVGTFFVCNACDQRYKIGNSRRENIINNVK